MTAMLFIAVSASLALASIGVPPPVPEGIHSEGSGSADVCGLTAQSVPALEKQIQARPDTEKLQGTYDYVAYATTVDGMRVLTFTTTANRAHPAVACRQVAQRPDGGSDIQTSIACFNNRENCDWLYRQFEALNERTVKAMKGKQ
jgi:hypothetical protein